MSHQTLGSAKPQSIHNRSHAFERRLAAILVGMLLLLGANAWVIVHNGHDAEPWQAYHPIALKRSQAAVAYIP